jgi:glucokinase
VDQVADQGADRSSGDADDHGVDAVIAVDIGGTKMAAARVDRAGRLAARVTAPTPAGDADELWAQLAALVDHVRADAHQHGVPLVGVGVGCGGPMTAEGEQVSPLNIPGWRSFPLRARLADHTGLTVHVDNDAKALALAEGWLGAARGVPNFMAMVVSTGVGGGIVLDGRLLDGASGNAGHIGHVVVEPQGAVLERHAQGTLEAEASGTAIAAHTGRPAAEADDAVVERTGRLVGRAVGSTCNLLDLGLVVVAGSVALGFGERFFAAAQEEIDRICILDFSRGARIGPAALGADGPLVGGAAVAWRRLGVDIGIA